MPATLSRESVRPSAEEHEVIAAMRAEGLAPYRWDNGSGRDAARLARREVLVRQAASALAERPASATGQSAARAG